MPTCRYWGVSEAIMNLSTEHVQNGEHTPDEFIKRLKHYLYILEEEVMKEEEG